MLPATHPDNMSTHPCSHSVCGLTSVANACYIHSVMQMLYSMTPIANRIIKYNGTNPQLVAMQTVFCAMRVAVRAGPIACAREACMLRISEPTNEPGHRHRHGPGRGQVCFNPHDAGQQSANALISQLFKIPDMHAIVQTVCGHTITHTSRCLHCGKTHRNVASPECVAVATLDANMHTALTRLHNTTLMAWCDKCGKSQNRQREYQSPVYALHGSYFLVMAQDTAAVATDYELDMCLSGRRLVLHGAICHRGGRAQDHTYGHYTYIHFCVPHKCAYEYSDGHVQPHSCTDALVVLQRSAVFIVYRLVT